MRHSRGVADTLTAVTRNWPSPNAMVSNDGESPESFDQRKAKHKARGINGNGMGDTLSIAAQRMEWPTPAARDHKGANSAEHVTENGTGRMHLDQLPNFVEHCFSPPGPAIPDGQRSSETRRVLNPRFVEWLMGWPIGWTSCELAETGLSAWLRQSRGYLSSLSSPRAADQMRLL
jgi:hypothetical protein